MQQFLAWLACNKSIGQTVLWYVQGIQNQNMVVVFC